VIKFFCGFFQISSPSREYNTKGRILLRSLLCKQKIQTKEGYFFAFHIQLQPTSQTYNVI